MSKPKFKIGDRVRAIEERGFIRNGDVGTVQDSNHMPDVKWDEPDPDSVEEVMCCNEDILELIPSQLTDEECTAKAKEFMYGSKETNPKDGLGAKKVPMSGMPAPVLMECGLVKLHGDLKYGRHNWRGAGAMASVYYDASMRHLNAWWEGEDLDPDSGIHHISHAITGLCVVRDSMMRGECNDDRPMPTEPGWISEMNETAKNMIEKHNL